MDTVKFNREISKLVDGMACNVFIPFHGTKLRKLAVELGYLDDSAIATVTVDDMSLLDMPEFTRDEISGIARTFMLYTRFDESRWKEIEIAEKDTKEGRAVFDKLMKEHLETVD